MNRPEIFSLGAAAVPAGRIGVLIVNLGTPDATDAASVRRYLREFLSDPRVIEDRGLVWKFILRHHPDHAAAPQRPRLRESIWNRELNESPLKTITRSQAAKLRAALDMPGVVVDWAMRYGNPSLDSAPRSAG